MFRSRDQRSRGAAGGAVHVAFTDASVNLQGRRPGFVDELARVESALSVRFARLHQVHGREVRVVDAPDPAEDAVMPEADALVTATGEVGLMIRVADCVPVLLADPHAGVIGAVHAGRRGVELDVVTAAIAQMRAAGAADIVAWVGPHVCGGCYEVPEQMRAEVCATVPQTHATTRWGTPALDLGAGVRAQLQGAGAAVHELGQCTLEDEGLHSYRRDGAASGRLAALIWTTTADAPPAPGRPDREEL